MGMSVVLLENEKPQPAWCLLLPNLGGWFFLFLLVCFMFLDPLKLLWDGGTCRHLITGVYVLTRHAIPTTNYVSALFPDVACLTHSFLGDLAFGLAFQLWNLKGVVMLSALAISLSLTWSYQFARARGLGSVSALLVLVLAMTACSMHWSARCHLFSYLAFLLLYWLNYLSSVSQRQRLFFSAIIMLCWVNVHGSFLIGILMLALKAISDWLEWAWGWQSHPGPAGAENPTGQLPATAETLAGASGADLRAVARWDIFTLIAAAAAICVNLRGPGFYAYVLGYLSHPMILFRSDEWRSLDFSLGIQTWSFLLIFAVLAALWALSDYRPRLWELSLILALYLAGLHTMRLIPYFVLAALPAMGPPWSEWRAASLSGSPASTAGWLKRLCLRFFALEVRVEAQERPRLAVAIARLAIAGLLCATFLLLPSIQVKDFNARKLPVKAVDYIALNGLTGLGFVLDNWGGYLYWRLGRPVFIDDWTDFYPLPFLQEYVATLMGQAGWQDVLDKYHIQYVLIPCRQLLGAALSASPGWQKAFEDQVSELYVRRQKVGVDVPAADRPSSL